jgi:hypothetical protein
MKTTRRLCHLAFFAIAWVLAPPVFAQNATVTLTSPADGATFTAPATIALAATAADSDGPISRVEFRNPAATELAARFSSWRPRFVVESYDAFRYVTY